MTKEKSKNLIKKVRKGFKVTKEMIEPGQIVVKEAPIKEEKNHAITIIIVWLAILTVLAIYVSIK